MAGDYSILDSGGYTMLDDQGYERLEGVGGPCCCGGDLCSTPYSASLQCDSSTGEAIGWQITQQSVDGWGSSWYDLNPGVLCSPKGIWITHPCDEPPEEPPAPPALPAHKCYVCFELTIGDYGWGKIWINGVLCSNVDPAFDRTPRTLRVAFVLCGNHADDMLAGTVYSCDGAPGGLTGDCDWINLRFWYKPSNDTLYIERIWGCTAGWETMDISDAFEPSAPSGGAYPDVLHYNQCRHVPSLFVGEYAECLGRNITVDDVGEEQSYYENTIYGISKLTACNQSDKKCYTFKSATCTQVVPGVWVWIPGSTSVQCLDTPPAGVDTWTNIGGNTWQIVREGDNCLNYTSCAYGSSETPEGVIACP